MPVQITTGVIIACFARVFCLYICTSPVIEVNFQSVEFGTDSTKDAGEDSPAGGVAIAFKILQFYKREYSLQF